MDVIGVVKSAAECSEIMSKAGKALTKRELTIFDSSGCEVRVTLWGEKAKMATPWHLSPIVAIKGAKVI